MIEALHYSAAGAKKKAVRLPAALFDGTVNEHALHRAVVTYLANQRQGTHDTRTRSEVSGGDRKSTRLNSSHGYISYAVFCLKKKKQPTDTWNTYAPTKARRATIR